MDDKTKKGYYYILMAPEVHCANKAGTRSIKSELKRFKLDRVEILKIDIEGAELEALPPLLEEVVICQILIEIHANPKEFVDFIVFMAKKGYRMFHFEINGLSMDLCEFSFIHDSCMDQFNAIPLAYFWELIPALKNGNLT
ncbi:unnamed protein product, partial [Mesorhabditis belari]|uniref:Methyltransferase FkbM domain-containing protein n=1 Tax=Mesorhabditis belari TaxID=2138241 RepID=A0AAF3EQN2_9BILA